MKKIWIVLALLLALACVFASCDKEETPNTGNNGNTEQGGSQNGNDDQESAHTHTYGDWSVSKAATCGAKGEEKRTCTCGESETREIAMLAHTWGDWITIAPATCVDKGAKMHICACGASAAEEIPATGEHHYGEWRISTSPTCVDKGEEKRVCTGCVAFKIREVAATGKHTYGDWCVTTIATCGAKGKEKRTCTRCTAFEAQDIAATGAHSYGVDNQCTGCQAPLIYTEGLEYILNDNGNSYAVAVGMATAVDNIIIPPYHKGKPVTTIGNHAFSNCRLLKSIVVPASVTTIESYAFASCILLKSIELPVGVRSIGDGVFSYCNLLASVEIPSSVTTIGYCAFSDCTSLKSIDIPASVTFIDKGAFAGCRGVERITVASGNTVYHSVGNCLIETTSKTLVAGCKNSVIPVDGSVTSIGSYAFYYCTLLASIEIPASVTSIGKHAFEYCTSLTSIVIPTSVTSIGMEAFQNCTSLAAVTFAETSGWWCSTSYDATSGTTISAADLADPATAATYLKSTYCVYYWHRTVE